MRKPKLDTTIETIPLVEEQLAVGKRRVETGRVRIRTVVDERLERVVQDLEHEDVTIERVPINREVKSAPEIRQEGDVLIIPLMAEVVVVEKRLVVKEELRVRKKRKRERIEEAVRLRGMHAEMQRLSPGSPPGSGLRPAGDRSTVAPSAAAGAGRAPRLRRKEPLI
jgi:uncharacterized protein (TIGR02271 family)